MGHKRHGEPLDQPQGKTFLSLLLNNFSRGRVEIILVEVIKK